MGRDMQVSDSVVIALDADAIYELVADPTQMPRWSPENQGTSTQVSAGPLQVGAVFDGRNKRGGARWTTQCVVTVAEPGRRFAFNVRKIGLATPVLPGGIATWDYTLDPVEGGTRVTETWTDERRRWPDFVAAAFDRAATGGRLFAEFQRGNIKRTLAAMKVDLEGSADRTA